MERIMKPARRIWMVSRDGSEPLGVAVFPIS